MIRQIFKKDWKILWPLVLGVTAAQFFGEWLLYTHAWTLFESGEGHPHFFLVSCVVLSSIALLIGMVVHQDAIADTRQDWRTRPIKGAHLLAAKLLFVLTAVHLPMLAANLVSALASGFPFGESLDAALMRNAAVLVFFSLPALALAALTRNTLQMLIYAFLLAFAAIAYSLLLNRFNLETPPYIATLDGWQVEIGILVLAALAGILILQYVWQKTAWTRALAALFLIILPVAQLPSQPITTITRWLSPNPGAATGISLALAPGERRLVQVPRVETANDPQAFVELPIRINGAPEHSLLMANRAELRLIDATGNTIHRVTITQPRIIDPADGVHFESLFLPRELYQRVREQPLRAELRYSMTLLQAVGPRTLTAPGPAQLWPGVGYCRAAPEYNNGLSILVALRCMRVGRGDICYQPSVVHGDPSYHVPLQERCADTKAPNPMQWLTGTFNHFTEDFFVKIPADPAAFPTTEQIVFPSHQVREHFTARLVISHLRLAELEADIGVPEYATEEETRYSALVYFSLFQRDRFGQRGHGSHGAGIFTARNSFDQPLDGTIHARLQLLPLESNELIAKVRLFDPTQSAFGVTTALRIRFRFDTPVTLIVPSPEEGPDWKGRWEFRFVVQRRELHR